MNDELLPMDQLRSIIDAFVEKFIADPMIGFFFNRMSKEKLKHREFEFAAAWMGHSIGYPGRALKRAHTQHPIEGSQFERRRMILEETLDAFVVPPSLKEAWLAHTDALRAQITHRGNNRCDAGSTRLESLIRIDGPLAKINTKKGNSE